MARARCALGLDFGTASVRALVIDVSTGAELGTAVAAYPHGVIDRALPGSSRPLDPDWALQSPFDYIKALESAVPAALRDARIDAGDVIGIGVDFTSCTILPIDEACRPLCGDVRFAERPHAWVKLWKHHAAQPQADRINAVARDRGELFLRSCGGQTSSEWLFAKCLQVLDEDPEIYDEASGFVEAGDWVVRQLTGVLVRNACGAGYKALWSREHGFPSQEFFGALDPRFRDVAKTKLPGAIVPPGRLVGGLLAPMAERLGLRSGTAVAAAIIDAHSAVPAATVVTPGRMVMVLGTSTCHMLLADRHAPVEGIAGIVLDGIVEGFHGYEAGQPAVGDLFAWLVHMLGATATGFADLEREADAAGPGSQGLLALDWWNGNRSVLARADLTGLIVGLTLSTTAAHVYRSLMEATGFGTRRILDALEHEGIEVDELIAVGGVADRSPLLLQIYANITGRPIRLAASTEASALGAAMLGAVAAGESSGGYATLRDASKRMAHLSDAVVSPEPGSKAVYDDLYREYLGLHDYFGRGGTTVMTRLRRLRRSS